MGFGFSGSSFLIDGDSRYTNLRWETDRAKDDSTNELANVKTNNRTNE